MFIKCLPVGHLMTNCYVVGDETSRLCAVIDPAGSAVGSDMFAYEPPDGSIMLREGSQIQVGPLTFDTLETPGHTPGGVTFRCGDALFTGDTLFQGSCGRTDLPGGSMEQELRSLARLASLEGDYEVYPGHMEASSLDFERRYNPYLTALKARGAW